MDNFYRKTIMDYPNLVKEWNYSKNTISPQDTTYASTKKVWWVCQKGHEWLATCNNRTNKNSECPYCSNKKVCEDNCLATLHPQIASEWHPTKNIISPFDIVCKSGQKVWWVCQKGHEWLASCQNRILGATGCPYCSNKKVCKDNCLATLHPRIALEWHPTKNGNLTPKEIIHQSGKKVWWLCKKGHEWIASPHTRVSKNTTNCPFCTNCGSAKQVCKDNCLATLYPQISSEWHPTKNGNLTPENILAKSSKKVWWLCKKGHKWYVGCGTRTEGATGCPYCQNKKTCKDNCLATLYPQISSEWHPTKNGNLTPEDVVPGSNKKTWWLCKNGHEWYVSCRNRTLLNSGCPSCCKYKGEIKIEELLKKSNAEFEQQVKLKECKFKRHLRFDFMVSINNKKFLIEYNGQQHYKPIKWFKDWTQEKIDQCFIDIKTRDNIKKEWCYKNNIPLLEIPYWKYDNIEEIICDFINNL